MQSSYIRHSDGVEVSQSDEEHTIDEIIETMQRGGDTTRERYGQAVRTDR